MRRLFLLLPLLASIACDDGLFGAVVGVQPSPSPDQLTLIFTTQPPNGFVNIPLNPPVQVTVQNGSGGVVTTSNLLISVNLSPNIGTPGATLTGSTQITAVNGVATFNNLRVDRVGTYALIAVADGAITGGSTTFTISP
jgi:hypothetical protein